ncbi:MAG: hypothetical protein INF90_14030 [Roseomonas sp.]|nr:hypothetical protein [Roseomonas sp.]
MANKRKTKRGMPREDLSRPSKWRLQHGDFTAPVREADPETGRPVQHRYAIDTLAVMLNNGTITREMHDAGASFRRHFRAAALDTLRAMPMIRMPGGAGDTLTEQQFQARKRVAGALEALGGAASPGGACVWHVVGLEQSITEWARQSGWGGKVIGHAQGQGVLVSALGVLAGYYGLVGERAGVGSST